MNFVYIFLLLCVISWTARSLYYSFNLKELPSWKEVGVIFLKSYILALCSVTALLLIFPVKAEAQVVGSKIVWGEANQIGDVSIVPIDNQDGTVGVAVNADKSGADVALITVVYHENFTQNAATAATNAMVLTLTQERSAFLSGGTFAMGNRDFSVSKDKVISIKVKLLKVVSEVGF